LIEYLITKIKKHIKNVTKYFTLFLSGVFIFFPALSHALTLTNTRHLFDIKYNFSEPSDISVSKDGYIYIVDGVNNKIKVFDQDGKFAFSFGRKGSGDGEFLYPLGIDIDDGNRVYVADSGNHRVQIFTSKGKFLSEIKIPFENDIMSDPTDISVDLKRNRIYVVDNNLHHVLVYDINSKKLLNTYGGPGEYKREFRFPFLMTLDTQGYLYIVDVINTRVQVLNPEGLFVQIIGGWGVEKGEFFRPKGIAIDRNNRVYVSDSYMGVIQVFDSTGRFHSAVGDTEKKTLRRFKTPTGIFIDSKNRLYVVEMFAQKVSVYSIEGDSE
jgi:DNA-binding beta-propeller fold protein YncE